MDEKHGHGTHVCGTVAGKKAADGTTESDGAADGVAPGAKLAFADIGDDKGKIHQFATELLFGTGRGTSHPEPRARIHSGSWGGEYNSYNRLAHEFDAYMHKNDDFLAIFAAGNSGRGDKPNSVGNTFKNGLVGE